MFLIGEKMRKAGAAILVVAAGGLLFAGATPSRGAAEEKKTTPAHETSTPAKKHPQTRPTKSSPPAKPTPHAAKPAPAASKPLVFTDEDLKRFHTGGEAPAARKVAPAPAPSDPLKPFKEQEERSRWQQARGGELQQKIIDLEARLKVLEQKRLSIQNPLLPRPAEPEGTRDAESGLTGPELLAKTEDEIREVSGQLDTARKDLAKFQDSNHE
jgi:hypothetical protein